MEKVKSMKRKDVNDDNCKQSRTIINRYCPKLFVDQQQNTIYNMSFIIVIALAKLYKIPLLTWFIDVFHRMMVSHWLNTNELLSPEQFSKTYQWMKDLKKNGLYNVFKHIIKTFHKRIFTYPEIGSAIQYKYDDDLNDYIDITAAINQTIRGKTNNSDYFAYPLQLDVWIIPKNVVIDDDTDELSDDDSDDSEAEEESTNKKRFWSFGKNKNKKQQQQKPDNDPWYIHHKTIGDIKGKLEQAKQDGIINDYKHTSVPRRNAGGWNDILNHGDGTIKLSSRLKEQYKRYILIIDRRKQNQDIHIYFYDAPSGSNEFCKEHYSYLRTPNFINSAKCVLPKDSTAEIEDHPKDISLFDSEGGYIFGLSYHLNSSNSTACWWTSGGSGIRMLATDMRDIWPWYFVIDEKTKNSGDPRNQKPKRVHFEEFRDLDFERFYQITTGNNLYERNADHSSNDNEEKDDEKNDEDEDEDADEVVVATLIQTPGPQIPDNQRAAVINKIKLLEDKPKWKKAVLLTIEHIQERFDEHECDPEDIIEDGDEDSELIDHLKDHGISDYDAKEFVKELIRKF